MANYPRVAVSFTDRVDERDTVVALDVNSLYYEVAAIATDLGAGTTSMGSSTPGLKYSAAWGIGSFDSTITTWNGGLQARIQNIENGLYKTYYGSLDITGKDGFNTIKSLNAKNVGLTILQGTVTSATVTYGASDGTTISYNASNTFTVGQKVTVTGLGIATGSPLNLSQQTITSLIGSAPTYAGFTMASPTVTGVTAATVGGSTSLNVTGDISQVFTGMQIIGTGIVSGTKVSGVSGQVVQMDTAASSSSSGSVSITFKVIGTSSGTGSAKAYQTTSLQEWQKDGGTVVASISPDGNLLAVGTAAIGGNTSVGGTLSVTKAATFSDVVNISGAVSIVAGVIDGGTP